MMVLKLVSQEDIQDSPGDGVETCELGRHPGQPW